MMHERNLTIVLVAVVAVFAATVLISFWEFTADDAYIYMRYAANFVDTGELVFNVGERVTTMTSPFLTLIQVPFYWAFGEMRVAYKVVSLLMLLATCLIVLERFPTDPFLRAVGLGVLLISPTMLFWTIGGLEVAPLALTVAATTSLVARPTVQRPTLVVFLAGIAFLIRFDSAPFMTVLVIGALVGHSWLVRVRSLLIGAAIPLAWLAFSSIYYGDIFPTSYYVKTPSGAVDSLLTNGNYVAQTLIWTAVIPLVIWVVVFRLLRRDEAVAEPDLSICWLVAALIVQCGYACTMATVHMMFGSRALLPYLPAFVILAGRLAVPLESVLRTKGLRISLAGFLAILLVVQGFQAWHVRNKSVQGFIAVGEYQQVSLQNMMEIIPRMIQLAGQIREHWEAQPAAASRIPRITTSAEGAMPFTYRDAYFFGELCSYRHGARVGHSWRPVWGDYMAFVLPVDSPTVPMEVTSIECDWGPARFRWAVCFNARPQTDQRLPSRVDGARR